ncbi:MAG TPA: biopolymer transporter ExbD [Bryobacteraceae bacterium]|jgi:biopolymer transport protein ExbD|nr:biopolymer transporter ExbD [Bryobacteraceae bacterium]
MGISLGSQMGNGRRGRRGGLPPMAEINIIPLVDVVLVLLIIFMLTAHVMEFGLEVDVPKVREVRSSAKELPVVTVTKEGEIQLNEKPVNFNLLGDEVRRRFPNETAVYVRADKGAVWEVLAQVVSELGEKKLQVQMVTQPVDVSARR